ncbi:hypothetical protein [Tsuneonella sp. HG222]
MDLIKTVETPIGKHKVEFKTLLTVAEAERVKTAQMEFIQTKDGVEFAVTNTAQVTLAEKHELLKVSIISIDGDATDCFDRIQKMYEPDGAFVYASILEAQKKMKDTISAE